MNKSKSNVINDIFAKIKSIFKTKTDHMTAIELENEGFDVYYK